MTTAARELKAPFPYPGGKSKVADLVWERFGDVQNYCEPFMGSIAVLLRRPAEHFRDGYRVETANDANHYLVNFWRAVRADPEAVAGYADWPVTEADLHARHRWLVRSEEADEFRAKMRTDPNHFDPRVAGWWVWGQCCWIGGAWCNDGFVERNAMPQVDVAHGVHRGPRDLPAQIDDLSGAGGAGNGVNTKKIPELAQMGRGDAATHREPPAQIDDLGGGFGGGKGVAAMGGRSLPEQVPDIAQVGRGQTAAHGRPQLTDAFDIGRGVNSGGSTVNRKKVPHMANGGQGVYALPAQIPAINGPGDGVDAVAGWVGTVAARRRWLVNWLTTLSDRLRLVRTCYGHWSRVCDSDSTLTRLGTTGVFLDPPYPLNRADDGSKSRDASLYINDRTQDLDALRDEVLAWCRKWGADRNIRVAVCCYEGDGYEPLKDEGWSVESWEANGGYGNQRKKKGGTKSDNAKRERIYFSPGCEKTPDLFAGLTAGPEIVG